MAFCTFSKEYDKGSFFSVETAFVHSFLPEASGDAVKVYLYGLCLCRNAGELTAADMADALKMTEEEIADYFTYWEEFGLVDIATKSPLTVVYLPVSGLTGHRKYRPEKYAAFNAAAQALITGRMISVNEYGEYFHLMETFRIKPEALLLIVKYCVDLKGNDIGYRYISAVAKDFASRGITTEAAVEKELSDYIVRSSEITTVLRAMSVNRKPDVEDAALYKKWREELGFTHELIVFAAKKIKKGGMQKLDALLLTLFANKRFSVQEAEGYLSEKKDLYDLTLAINRALSLYYETIDTVVDTYVAPWKARGYNAETLLMLAQYCFKHGRRSYERMDELIDSLYQKGLVSLDSIAAYMRALTEDDKLIRRILGAVGVDRRPTDWDRENLRTWRGWNFSDEMVELAASHAAGKSSPIPYMNAVLSNWRTEGKFTPESVASTIEKPRPATVKKRGAHFESERKYTKEELDALVSSVDDIEL